MESDDLCQQRLSADAEPRQARQRQESRVWPILGESGQGHGSAIMTRFSEKQGTSDCITKLVTKYDSWILHNNKVDVTCYMH